MCELPWIGLGGTFPKLSKFRLYASSIFASSKSFQHKQEGASLSQSVNHAGNKNLRVGPNYPIFPSDRCFLFYSAKKTPAETPPKHMCHAAMLNQIVVSHHHHWDSPMGLEWYYYGTHRRKDDHDLSASPLKTPRSLRCQSCCSQGHQIRPPPVAHRSAPAPGQAIFGPLSRIGLSLRNQKKVAQSLSYLTQNWFSKKMFFFLFLISQHLETSMYQKCTTMYPFDTSGNLMWQCLNRKCCFSIQCKDQTNKKMKFW